MNIIKSKTLGLYFGTANINGRLLYTRAYTRKAVILNLIRLATI